MTTHTPLIPHTNQRAIIAHRAGRAICVAEFLYDIQRCAAQLNPNQPYINLCGDRYLFAVGLFAAVWRGALTLLPHNTSADNIAQLSSQHPGLSALIEESGPSRQYAKTLPCLLVSASGENAADSAIPSIPDTQLVARLYTSGSTGTPQAHDKHWGKLVKNILSAAQAHYQRIQKNCHVLATVPAQHMYGFESSILFPLFSGGVLMADYPFFPADVISALAATPRPRALISTPFHLRTLLECGLTLPSIDLIICATAPLTIDLARRLENQTQAVLSEVYGSTETGQIASRRTTSGPTWQTFAGVTLTHTADQTWVSGDLLEAPICMGDVLEILRRSDDNHTEFLLHGRHADLINIAGKRNSINHLNSLLCMLPGVEDGCFWLPQEPPSDGIVRLVAFAVAPQGDKTALLQALRQQIDPVFLPRPLILVPRLPRNSTGKLTQQALAQLFAQYSE